MSPSIVAEGRIPEEAIGAAEDAAEDYAGKHSDLGPVDIAVMGERALEAGLDALPSEWLLARALTKAELTILSMDETHEGRPCSACDDLRAEARAKLRAALSLLEQETGGDDGR